MLFYKVMMQKINEKLRLLRILFKTKELLLALKLLMKFLLTY